MKSHVHGSIAVGMCLVIALVASTAVPSYAQRSGGGSRGGGATVGRGAPGATVPAAAGRATTAHGAAPP